MNASGIPRTSPQSSAELAHELEHLIEANQTTRILVREACATLMETVELHLDQTDAQLKRLLVELRRR
ncbi:MAG TPA: hypothetical protein VG841_09060 [Caulobacterales bacterium]|nr:hypothetical protein [Caulobacterales bacterium]